MKKIHYLLLASLSLIIAISGFTFFHNKTCTYSIVNTELSVYQAKVVTAGGVIGEYDLACYDSAITFLKEKGTWGKVHELGTLDYGLAPSKIKLKYTIYDTVSLIGFNAGDYDTLTGFTGNGTSKYINTNFSLAATDNRDISLGFYSHDDGNKGAGMGTSSGTGLYVAWGPSAGSYSQSTVGNSTLFNATAKGLISVTSNFYGVSAYMNDVLRGTRSATGTLGNIGGNLTLFSFNGTNYFTGKISLYYVASALTSEDTKNLSDAIERLYNNIGRRNPNRIVCIGDSNTWGPNITNKLQRWGEILADSMNCEAVITGFSSTLLQYQPASHSMRSRFSQDMIAHKADKYFILYGLNDVFYNTSTIAQFSSQLRYEIKYLKDSGIDSSDIYVGTPPYVDSIAGYTRAAPFGSGSLALHKQYNDSVMVIAASMGVVGVDDYTYLKNNGANTLLQVDKVHQNTTGHLKLANCFFINL